MGVSASRNDRKASAPVGPSALVEAADATVLETGSVASYAESSEARSAGRTGALGVAGAVKSLTTPTCASFAYERSQFLNIAVILNAAHLGRSLVTLQLLDVEILDKV